MWKWPVVKYKYIKIKPRRCTNNGAITAVAFVNMMLSRKENIIFPDILRQDMCYIARQLFKKFHFANGPVYYSIDRLEFKG